MKKHGENLIELAEGYSDFLGKTKHAEQEYVEYYKIRHGNVKLVLSTEMYLEMSTNLNKTTYISEMERLRIMVDMNGDKLFKHIDVIEGLKRRFKFVRM